METNISKVKYYRAAYYKTVHARTYIDAKSEEEALELAQEILENDSMLSDAKIFNKDFETCITKLSN